MSTQRLSRRSLLRGLGLGAGASLLGPLVTRIATAQSASRARFLFVVEGNCFEPITMLADAPRAALDATLGAPIGPQRWWYRSYRHDVPLAVDTDFAGAPALGAFAADPALSARAQVVFGLSSRTGGGGHSGLHGVLASARTVAGVPGGQTIDAYLGALPQVRGVTPYDAVRLGVAPDNAPPVDFGTCAFGRGRAAPLVLRPADAYDALFGSVGTAASRAAFAGRRRILDFAAADVNATLAAFPGNSAERAKLEAYLSSIEEITTRHQRMSALAPQLTSSQPPAPGSNPLYMGQDPLDRFRAQLELATAAFKGELTRVAVVGCGTGGKFNLTYDSVSPDVSRHELHHGSAGSPEFRRRIHDVTRLQVEAIAGVARTLAATPEAGATGSMLDHTVIVYIGDNGEQHHSTATEFPVLIVGGQAVGFRGGRTVVYPGHSSSGHRQVSNLWNTLGYAAGDALDDFGAEGPARRARGPLAELRT